MTKQKLEQYLDLKREIKILNKDIQIQEKKYKTACKDTVKDTVASSTKDHPFIRSKITISGIRGKRVAQLDAKRLNLIIMRNKAEVEAHEIIEWIKAIEDSKTRQVFYLRYIKGFAWQQVAYEIDETDEQYPRKVIHDKYLKNCTKSTNLM